jgi:GNAT superfamily N-acetyltransferase
MTIRDIEPERDAEGMAALLRSASPTAVVTAAAWLHGQRLRTQAREWVAEIDGVLVGRASALERFYDGAAGLYVTVLPAYRAQGVGSALYDVAFGHASSLGGSAILSDFYETPEAVRFAQARGFREVRGEQPSILDPRAVTEEPTAELRAVSDVDPRVVFRIDDATTPDVPSHERQQPMPYDQWEQWFLRDPLFQAEGSFVAYADGEPAAISLLQADLESGRATNTYTATLREFRGRGLGRAAKLGSIRWAAAHGITSMSTINDETNAPMLAINRRLGYRPIGRRVEYSRP